MILVTGATGQLGQIVINKLSEKLPNNQIAALVRDAAKGEALSAKGIDVRVGDYHDKDGLLAAFHNVEKLLLISSNDFNDRFGQHKNAVDAAVEAGVKHIFYTGVSMNDIQTSPLKPFLEDHYLTEDYIKSSGLTYTFLENGLYAEVLPMFLGENVTETGLFFPAGEGKVAFATRKDLGEAAAHILLGHGHENQTYKLTGAVAYSFDEVANTLSELSGKNVPYISPEPEVFVETLKQFGLPEHIIQMSLGFALGMKNNDFDKPYDNLEKFLGRNPTTLTEFLKEEYKL
ncbi:MAG TPA: SDR family oxidoreductase [Leadbetterella sp.]|nr:SDR family oxidoreductase [Leadbetterella sp.]